MEKFIIVLLYFFLMNNVSQAQTEVKLHAHAYTDTNYKFCTFLEWEEVGGYSLSECPGFGGWQILITEGDARAWLVLKKNNKIKDFQEKLIGESPFLFPYIGDKIEWRFSKKTGKPHSIILRMSGQDSKFEISEENPIPPTKSQLYIIRLGDNAENSCIIGTSLQNVEAAKIADDMTKACHSR